MPVVEWKSDAVQAKALEEGSILVLEEIFQELRIQLQLAFNLRYDFLFTLSKKSSDFFSPIVLERAARIWCSQPG